MENTKAAVPAVTVEAEAWGHPGSQQAGLRAEQELAASLAMTEVSRLEHQPAGVETFCKMHSFQ